MFFIFLTSRYRKYLNLSSLENIAINFCFFQSNIFYNFPCPSLLDFSVTFYSVLVFTGVSISAEYKLRGGLRKIHTCPVEPHILWKIIKTLCIGRFRPFNKSKQKSGDLLHQFPHTPFFTSSFPTTMEDF